MFYKFYNSLTFESILIINGLKVLLAGSCLPSLYTVRPLPQQESHFKLHYRNHILSGPGLTQLLGLKSFIVNED